MDAWNVLEESASAFDPAGRPGKTAKPRSTSAYECLLIYEPLSRGNADSYETGVIRELISMTTYLPPFLRAVTDQARYDSAPQPDDVVTSRRGPGITSLQTFHVVRHQECKWHVIVLR